MTNKLKISSVVYSELLRTATPAWYGWTATRGKWIPYRHLLLIDDALMDCVAGKTRRLMVFMPPQHGKSMFLSRIFPAWYLGTYPDNRVILASYAAELASSHSRKCRDLLESTCGMFHLRLSRKNHASHRWGVDGYDGGMLAAGVGGPLTGHGADLAIIDDPVKNAEESFSQRQRDKILDWYLSVFMSRVHDSGVVILIMTRWHEDDLAGRLIRAAESGGDKWRVISLPALATGDDPLGRKPGEPLCPDMYSRDTLIGIRDGRIGSTAGMSGSYWWNSLYQQKPVPREGGVIKREWVRFYDRLPRPESWERIIQSWDMTFKTTTTGSFVTGQLWISVGADRYLVDQDRFRGGFTDTRDAVLRMIDKYPSTQAVLIEDAANGPAIIDALSSRVAGLTPVKARGSKEARLSAVSPQFRAGNVYLPRKETAPWVDEYIEELTTYPAAAHDDQVDATSQALSWLPIGSNVRGGDGDTWIGNDPPVGPRVTDVDRGDMMILSGTAAKGW